MKKLLFIPLLIGIVLNFNSCNVGEGRNEVRVEPTYAIVDNNPNTLGGILLGTSYGYFSALSSVDFFPGDCFYMRFTVDFDKQPASSDFMVVSDIEKIAVNKTTVEEANSVDIGNHTFKISKFNLYPNPYFHGKVFLEFESNNQIQDLRLVYNTEEEDEAGVKNLYLLASAASSNTSSYIVRHAFDINNLFNNNSRDTTIYEGGMTFDLRYIKANINYISDMKEDGEPNYTKFEKPFEIFIFK